jgi:hypothetical protein
MVVSWRIVKETQFLLRRQLLHYLLAEEKSEEKREATARGFMF